MPVLSRLPAPSPRGGGRSSAAVPGARSRRRSVGARGSSRAGRPRPEGGGPGSECDAALLCTCHDSPGRARRPLTDPSQARPSGTELSRRCSRAGSAGRTHSPRGAAARAAPHQTGPSPAAVPPPSGAATAR